MFRYKQAEVQARLREEQARLAQIEFRLRQIEQEGMMQTVDIVIKRIEPFYALTFRGIFHTRQEREVVGKAIEQAIKEGRIKPIGATPDNPVGSAPINIFYEEEFQGEYADTEGVAPVESTHTPVVSLGDAGTLTLREIPAIEQAATYLHQGDY